MLQRFKQYIESNRLIVAGERVIVALSGGIDSIVLTHLMAEAGYDIVAAHCNFNLRGDESDGDERFVEAFCKAKDITLHTRHFDTEAYAKANGVSIEMAARELRYRWFEELRKELSFDKIAVAHHADDQIETFLINLLRGSGIHGLKAMLPQNANIVRPLLWASRNDIRHYALHNALQWHNDSTNDANICTRNKLRNIVIPQICLQFGNARKSIGNSINFLTSECALYDELVRQHILSLQTEHDGTLTMPQSAFANANGKQLLFEWIRPYGFNTAQLDFIAEAMTQPSGQCYLSPTHRLRIEHNNLVISILKNKAINNATISTETGEIAEPVGMSITVAEKDDGFTISRDPRCATIDSDTIKFPLLLRQWQHGDRFKPLGMRGTKLVSDFLAGLHLTPTEKEEALVVEDADKNIIWVVGRRIDDRFKVTEKTKNVATFMLH